MIITIIIKSRKKVRRFEGFFKYKYLVIECMHVDCESKSDTSNNGGGGGGGNNLKKPQKNIEKQTGKTKK